MILCLHDPRRVRRVPIRASAAITFGSASWSEVTFDVSPEGCGLTSQRPLARRDEVFIVLRHDRVAAMLRTHATVAWTSRDRLGLKFKDVSASRRWFEDLVSTQPHVRGGERPPRSIAVTATVARRGDKSIYGPIARADALSLTPNESLVFDLVSARTPVRAVALAARLPSHEFARALFGLIGKGLVACDDSAAPVSDRTPAPSCSVVIRGTSDP